MIRFNIIVLLMQKKVLDHLLMLGVESHWAPIPVITEKILNFMPNIAVISMDNYNDASRIDDRNFDGKSPLLDFIYWEILIDQLW